MGNDPADLIRLPSLGLRDVAFAPLQITLSIVHALFGRFGRNCDAVLVNHPSPTSGLVGLCMSVFSSKPLIVDFCDDIAQYAVDLLGLEAGPAAWLLRFVQRVILAHCAGGILATEYLREEIPRASRTKPWTVIPNGVDPAVYPATPQRGSGHTMFTLAYAGRYEGWAGSRFIESLAGEVLRRGVAAEIVVAGSAAKSQGPAPLRFVGVLAPEDVPKFLSASDAVLVPFPPGRTSDAASPIKLFEGWAAGVPTLASNVAGIREVARDGVDTLLLPPSDVAAWADAIEHLMQDPSLRGQLSLGARRSAETATWAARAASFAQSLAFTLETPRA